MLNSDTQRQSPEGFNGFHSPFPLMEEPVRMTEARGTDSLASDNFASPFAEVHAEAVSESEAQAMFAEALDELRDEQFDEAVANLAEETEEVVSSRFINETSATDGHRERLAEAHLAPIAYEAEQYLSSLASGVANLDLPSMTSEQMSEALDRLDPKLSTLSIGGEQFIGKLIKKAKSVVKFVANTAAKVGKVAGGLLGPILNKLKAFVKPLLQRVLGFAIGKLPAAVQPAARMLATKFLGETSSEQEYEAASPANLADVEAISEQFDESLAESITQGLSGEQVMEDMLGESYATGEESAHLQRLTEARAELMRQFSEAQENEDLAPAVEQFVPALLGALRIGINIIGRPKVVQFLAGLLAKLISKWVGPQMAGTLSSAIVDMGLRLITLEAEHEHAEGGQSPVAAAALAAVVEDTVRRFAENEDYVFESQELMQLAASDAFGEAVATYMPQRFVRSDLQQSPSLGGTFVPRMPKRLRSFSKYSRLPEVEITQQMADAVPTFGGSTLGAVLRAAGVRMPFRARLHIYQAHAGSSLPTMLRSDRGAASRGGPFIALGNVQPLTSLSAGMLLREPRLGVDVPGRYLQSRHRIAVGQRFFALEGLGGEAQGLAAAAQLGQRANHSRSWISVSLRKARVTVGFYFSDADAQELATAIRQARGPAALLQALAKSLQAMHLSPLRTVYGSQEVMEGEQFSLATIRRRLPRRIVGMLRKKLAGWIMPALAAWVKTSGEAFVRAMQGNAGVTIRLELSNVPGLSIAAALSQGAPASPRVPAYAAKPAVNITVASGSGKRA